MTRLYIHTYRHEDQLIRDDGNSIVVLAEGQEARDQFKVWSRLFPGVDSAGLVFPRGAPRENMSKGGVPELLRCGLVAEAVSKASEGARTAPEYLLVARKLGLLHLDTEIERLLERPGNSGVVKMRMINLFNNALKRR